ncbi:MAG TPA: hypothetical protein VGE94_03280 [Chloroflexota bacterium]
MKMSAIKRYVAGGVVATGLLLGVSATSVLADGATSGLSLPPTDPALAYIAPSADQANYAARLEVFLEATVPDVWNGQPVEFLSTYSDAGGVDVLGLPTSAAKGDPSNPSFVYQRFQNGVLFYNATEGSTQVLGT